MALGGTDLNLLLPLKVLLEEGNVTRAGQRLSLSQPTMSAALARLRRRFDDELLVRAGREYELTPFARDLLPEVQQAVRLVGVALDLEDAFDPSTSKRTFRLVMSDYALAAIHEPLVRLVEAEAPGVRLTVGNLGAGAHLSEQLLVDNDALVAPMGFGFHGVSRPLWTDRMVLLADRNNPRLVDGRLTLEDLSELPYASGTFGAGVLTPADRVFGEFHISHRPVLQVFGFLPLPFVIEGTDMYAVVPEMLARLHARPGCPLVMVEPPFGEALLAEGYWFAEHRLSDPAYRWLFGRLEAASAELSLGADPMP
ncbi:LysR family transcriptional regulator [Nocardioides sp. KR10-350]|uniref:LysR family transcriptional regulator n=1 Tax=Nocardioides cheoyonin TaxID=3156615 RepID=UPI0032B40743